MMKQLFASAAILLNGMHSYVQLHILTDREHENY